MIRMRQYFADDTFTGIFFKDIFVFLITDMFSLGSNSQWVSIGSGNDLVLNRWQAITWTNVDPNQKCHNVTRPNQLNMEWNSNDISIDNWTYRQVSNIRRTLAGN